MGRAAAAGSGVGADAGAGRRKSGLLAEYSPTDFGEFDHQNRGAVPSISSCSTFSLRNNTKWFFPS